MKKSLFAGLLCLCMLFAFAPVTVFATEVNDAVSGGISISTGYVTVNDGTTQYASLDEAVAAATKDETIADTVTYHIYGAVTATGDSTKYTPDLALDGKVQTVNVIGENENATVTLSGVYYQRFAAEGATLNVQNVIMDDDKRSSGEGKDKDPWEFTYIQPECASVTFTNCTFKEGILISVDATFDGCIFTMTPEYYKDLNDGVDYSGDHYQLWIHNYGDVIVKNCIFKDATYGAIKSTWNKYGTNSDLTLSVTNSTFENITNKVPANLDGAAKVVFTGNTLTDDCKQNNGSYIKSDITISDFTEENNTVKHALNFVPPVDATCKVAGTGEYWLCVGCSKMFKDSTGSEELTAIPPVSTKSHTYLNGKCTMCGTVEENYVAGEKVEMQVDKTTTDAVEAEAENVQDVILNPDSEKEVEIEIAVSEAVMDDIKEKLSDGATSVEIVTEVVAQTVTEEAIKESAQEDAAKIEEAVTSENANIVQYLDLSVLIKAVETKTAGESTEEKVTTLGELTKTSSEITFTISVPDALKREGIKVTVIRVHDGVVTPLETTEVKDTEGKIIGYSFKTDRFSTYAVTYTATVLPAPVNGVITLTENVALADTVVITEDTVIDLNGFVIKGEKATNFHITSGTLTVKDSSTDSTGAILVDGEAFRVGVKSATNDPADSVGLVIESGVDVTSSNDSCVVIYAGTLTTSGNLTNSGNYATITGSGAPDCDGTVININGGSVTNTNNTAVYHPQVGTMTVKDGAITGTTGIEMRAGNLTVEGGTITATGTFSEASNGNGSTVTGVAVAVSQHTTNNAISVTIKGGTLSCNEEDAKALYEKDLVDDGDTDVTMSVIGGTFNGDVASENVKEFVSGGSFQTEVPAEFCAENYVPSKNADGTYGVHNHVLKAHAANAADCTKTGNIAYWHCEACDTYYSDAEGKVVITKDDITTSKTPCDKTKAILVKGYAPTCTEEGLGDGTKCATCGEWIGAPGNIQPLGHKLTAYAEVAPTCTETGTEAYWYCETCQKYYSDAEGKNEIAAPVVIPALGHAGIKHDDAPATCTESGWEGEVRCERCDLLLEANEENQPFGHTYVDGVCVVCGEAAQSTTDMASPATGDTSNTGLWVFIAVLACVSLAGSVVLGKKTGYLK